MKSSSTILKSLFAILLCAAFTARAQERAYDIIKSQYAIYTAPNDPLAFPAKVWALQANQYAFWRGSRDLYYRWCRDNAADWLADRESYVLNHGDLHLGNIGTYVKAREMQKTEFGMVDFDDTAKLPFQIELLQGLVTLRLAARTGNVDLTGNKRDLIAAELFDAYRIALMTGKSARELVTGEKRIGKFIDAAQNDSYEVTLKKFTHNGKFKPAVETAKKKELKEILRPAMDRADDLARGIAQAINNSPDAKTVFRYSDIDTVRKSIKDVTLRTRLESVGSQGLKKYLVLLEKPLKQLDMDVVLYVKQEIPAAAERAGAIERDESRSPGRRASEDMEALTNPTAYMNSWCDIGNESFWVTFKEPWSEELDDELIKSFDALKEAARVWGSVAGAMHRENGDEQAILKRLTPPMEAVIRHRGTSYMAELDRQFFDFLQDDRVKADAGKANQLIEAARLQAQARAAAR